MSKRSPEALIRLRGVRHNNLKNFDLDLPIGRLIVVTGPSGSGKSSLAFDTLYAEGQRRYIETFSPYARQFFERMDKPQVDSIHGIPPAIAIEQRNSVKSTRSTVGTMTEVCDYMKIVWAHLARLFCRQCHQPVRKDSPQRIWEELQRRVEKSGVQPTEAVITFELALSEKLSLADSLALIAKQGYQRIWFDAEGNGFPPEMVRLEEALPRLAEAKGLNKVTIVQDRIRLETKNRSRFVEGCEQAYHFGKGKCAISFLDGSAVCRFSNRFHCATCDIDYREPSPALFSFNHPVGACPACRGFGRTITIDYDLAIPDRSRSLAKGAVKPWQTGQSAECQKDLMKTCRERRIPVDLPFEKLSKEAQQWVIEGDANYGRDSAHEWPRAWYGVKGYFRWLESKAYKMHVRVLLSRYRAYRTCPDCKGRRFQPDALLFKQEAEAGKLLDLSDFYQLPVRDALTFVQRMAEKHPRANKSDPLPLVLAEVGSRLGYLDEVGLGYLTLDRPTRSLSGGETERVSLTTCLGSRLVNTLFVLDEPTVGLHARDTLRLVRILEHLRDSGNTVVVVEHEPSVMRSADQIVDLGPGHGESGGDLVFQGTYQSILKAPASLTGSYLSGQKQVGSSLRRKVNLQTAPSSSSPRNARPVLTISQANLHNLKNVTAEIPLQRFVCVTGVSGSGKTTLIREVLLPLLEEKLRRAKTDLVEGDVDAGPEVEKDAAEPARRLVGTIQGWETLDKVVSVDQSLLGKTPRSNPAVYVGAFDEIRELFAQSDAARQRGLNASAFSFNSRQGQCEVCRGAGFEKIEMQFLSDVYIRCPACNGRRYRQHILDVKIQPEQGKEVRRRRPPLKAGQDRASSSPSRKQNWSIADMLDATVDEATHFLAQFPDSRPAARAAKRLQLLQEVGLGYLRLGQPINTLSGGESQRLKLVSHLAESASTQSDKPQHALFLFDEPTTGLHFDDVRILLQVFQRLVNEGHSILVIEHNLDLIRNADWVIDLGPGAGDMGGTVVAAGTPEAIAACPGSSTGECLNRLDA